VIRAVAFVTPSQGRLLNPQITIRRRAAKAASELPKTILILTDGAAEARIPVNQGQAKLTFAEISRSLPKAWLAGLPSGQYTLRVEAGLETVTFAVEDESTRRRVMKPLDDLLRLTGQTADLLFIQVAVEHFLAQQDEHGRGQPYLVDALDLLESVATDRLSPTLREHRQTVLWRLGAGKKPSPAPLDGAATGNAEIDVARRDILQGWWSAAQEKLKSLARSPDRRTRALAAMYQGVIYAEAGLGKQSPGAAPADGAGAESCFRTALADLEGAAPSDLYRAHCNFANHLLRRTQDRLYNHSFQMAAGVEHPLLAILNCWREAQEQYAFAIQEAKSPDERASVAVSLSQLYSLLADILGTLQPSGGGLAFAALRNGATQTAAAYARQAADALAIAASDPRSVGIADEVLAHLAFREGNLSECLKYAEQARKAYLSAGSLVGLESVHRLIGSYDLRLLDTASGKEPIRAARAAALHNLLIAHVLSETLRERFPADRLGLSRAGFFARRAYVYEKIMELLLADGKDAEALHYAELAKARSLQDLLNTQGIQDSNRFSATADLESLAADWPKGVAGLEYFLGRERAWVFVIGPGFAVKAYPLTTPDGRLLDSRNLISDVRRFLDDIGFQSRKMRERLTSDEGFDHAWQDTLHRFYRELLPPGVLRQLRDARTVIVVPHHILHYFPFAALVTEPDREPRGKMEMVKPRFLVDEPFDLCHAPSLASWLSLQRRRSRPIAQAAAMGIVDFPGAPVLSGVTRDLENVRSVFGDKTVVYADDDAKLSNAQEMFHRAGLLLFATHGVNFGDRPLESCLLMYSDKGEPSQLTAGDLYRTQISADLVVMNACYSGLADRSPSPGDDLFGLQRAFLRGGARTIVSGIWDVYDGTAPDLIDGFLKRIVGGDAAARAWAQSQRDFLAKLRASKDAEPWLHPYFWAVFTVMGDNRTCGAIPAASPN
jgi:CHAT domain-containing protein